MVKRLLEWGLVTAVLLTLAGLLLADETAILNGILDHEADAVFGQPTFFTSAGGAGANSFELPTEMAFDGQGNMWVGEWSNCAVLRFGADGDTTADLIIGQAGFSAVYGGTSDTMMGSVGGLTRDAFGNLYVSDVNNRRILRFEAGADGVVNDTTADFVIGQPTFFTSHFGLGETMLMGPRGLAVDRNGNLYVADATRYAILRFNADSDGRLRDTAADFIFGQPSFHILLSGASPHTFNFVRGLVFDPAGNLYTADASNRRVLRFNASETGIVNDSTPDLLFGQAGYFTAYAGVSDTMILPFDAAVDAFGNLWTADRYNNRVLRFNAESSGVVNDTTADFVLGGGDTFFGFDSAVAGASDTMMYDPGYLDFDNSGNLYVSDVGNNRVLRFNAQWIFSTGEDNNCFLATAAYGQDAKELDAFHQFRDEVLMHSSIGRGLVSFYYTHGPAAASFVIGDASRFITRATLTPVLGLVKIINLLGLFGTLVVLILTSFGYLSLRTRLKN